MCFLRNKSVAFYFNISENMYVYVIILFMIDVNIFMNRIYKGKLFRNFRV